MKTDKLLFIVSKKQKTGEFEEVIRVSSIDVKKGKPKLHKFQWVDSRWSFDSKIYKDIEEEWGTKKELMDSLLSSFWANHPERGFVCYEFTKGRKIKIF